MADKDKEKDKDKTKKETPPASGKAGILTWVIMAVIIAVLSGSGFVLGGLFAKPSSPDSVQAEEKTAPVKGPNDMNESMADVNETWYYNDLEPVVVNPDEPGATRFVRVGLTLEMSSILTTTDANSLIALKKPLMINWLNLYFKSLTLAEMKDDRDIQRILLQIGDAFNDMLFPDSKPLIKKVLIKEFNIQ